MKKSFVLFFIFLCLSYSATAQKKETTQDKNTEVVSYRFVSETYPGVEPGEVFLTIISTEWTEEPFVHSDGTTDYISVPSSSAAYLNFKEIGWKTKRLGEVAYDTKGQKLDGHLPVFVQKKELQEAGVLKK